MFNPMDTDFNDIRIDDEVKYHGEVFTVVDILGDNLIVVETDKGKCYRFVADNVKRIHRPMHVSMA